MALTTNGNNDDGNELLERLAEQNRKLTEALEKANARIRELEVDKNQAPTTLSREASDVVTPINEADVTLRRLVQRIAMILQAQKIVIMFHDRDTDELKGIPPTFGVDEEKLANFRVKTEKGVSGQVFRDSEPAIYHDIEIDPRTQEDPFEIVGATNGLTVPLVIEKRDDENRVTERSTIGVLHALDKRHGDEFNDEDVRLLERMARNVGSIIANLQMYREVVEENEELAQTFESVTAGLLLVSPDFRVSQMNSLARAVFEAPKDAVGKPADDILKNEDTIAMLRRALEGEDPGKSEITIHLAGSERIYEGQAASVTGEGGKSLGVVAIFNDVTDIRNIDRMKSGFVAMASHELRTPLTAIKGFSSTLLEGLDDDIYSKEDQREFLGIVVGECDRLRRLIDDLLNTSRIEAGESLKPDYQKVDIATLLDKVAKVQQQSTTKHKVKVEFENAMPAFVNADPDKLDQIITNLMNNAVKYAPDGGDIILHAKNEGETLLIGVRDQGLGIPKDYLTKVFDRFTRVNNEDNRKIYGTGLGLFLVKHLVEDVHKGHIWVESEVGVGSDFIFRMPIELDIEAAKASD